MVHCRGAIIGQTDLTTLEQHFKECGTINDVYTVSVSAPKEAIKERLRPPRPGVHISPSFQELSTMTNKELSAVNGFMAWNEYGKIMFTKPVDLVEVDLSVIKICNDFVEVYDEETEVCYPAVGEKLNQPAQIELKINVPQHDLDERIDGLNENGGQHKSYSAGSWIFTVPHWTKWGAKKNKAVEESKQEQIVVEQTFEMIDTSVKAPTI